jgi:3-methyladenine DNA glycosylase AlkD
MDAPALSAVLSARLAEQGSAERADGEKRYLHSDLTHLGVRLPLLRTTTRQLLRDEQLALPDRLMLVEELWNQQVFDLRQAAVIVLEHSKHELDVSHLTLIERLIRNAHTWALVDPLATNVTGDILQRCPDARAVLDRWITDTDFWIRRAALLAYLRPLRETPDTTTFDAFATYADRVLDEREFFIRKAIGWVLREVGKRNASLVIDWLTPRTQRASGVTMREAVKYLPDADAARLMDAYRARTIS